jgi:hypothetical protein
MHRIKDARHVGGYRLEILYEDGERTTIDFTTYLDDEAFARLKELERFTDFRVDRQYGTIVWDKVADFYPDAVMPKTGPLDEYY